MADSQPTSVVETWKPVVGYEGAYEVSSAGRVRSLARTVVCKRRPRDHSVREQPVAGCIRRQHIGRYGYPLVALGVHGKRTVHAVHRLVLAAFIGPCPEGMEACHNNGNRADNRVENLRWDTRSANFIDKRAHGTASFGERNKWAKLTWEQVRAIRREYRPNHPTCSRPALAKKYGVGVTAIDKILSGKTWPAAFDATFKNELEKIHE